MLVEILLLITSIVILDYLIKKKRNDITHKIGGPKSYPLFGGAWALMTTDSNNLLEDSIRRFSKYGKLYKVWVFNRLEIFSSDPKDLEIILSSPKYINKGALYDLLQIWLGQGLLLSSGAKWHSRRKIITPTFHFKILEQFLEVFDEQSAILVQKLEPKAKTGEMFNIQPFICLAALDIIAETAMGTKVNAQTDSENEYVKAVADILLIMSRRLTSIWLRFEWLFSAFYGNLKQKQNRALKVLHSFTEKVIERRREALEKSKSDETIKDICDDDICSKKRMALLDILLQATSNGKPLSNEDIREEVDTFMFEGHDTTTSAICSALFCISRDAEVQRKAFEEIQQVFGSDKQRKIEMRDLQELKYLECIIKETLRLYPVVPMFSRNLPEQTEINGRTIPAGANYSINVYAMQRDKNIFPNPEKFTPERHFSNNSTDKMHPYSYIPFSAGPRNCIGQKFAMFEMKSTLSKILRHYELLSLGPDMNIVTNLVLRSKNGVHMGLKERLH